MWPWGDWRGRGEVNPEAKHLWMRMTCVCMKCGEANLGPPQAPKNPNPSLTQVPDASAFGRRLCGLDDA